MTERNFKLNTPTSWHLSLAAEAGERDVLVGRVALLPPALGGGGVEDVPYAGGVKAALPQALAGGITPQHHDAQQDCSKNSRMLKLERINKFSQGFSLPNMAASSFFVMMSLLLLKGVCRNKICYFSVRRRATRELEDN